jgi:hypothetical protein
MHIFDKKSYDFYLVYDYEMLATIPDKKFGIVDHLNGFKEDYSNEYLDLLKGREVEIFYINYLKPEIHQRYPNIKFRFDANLANDFYLKDTYNLNSLSKIKFDNIKKFLCCFNYSAHPGRLLLTSALFKMKMWDNETCTKYFENNVDQMDGYIQSRAVNERLYTKLIIDRSNEGLKFYRTRFEQNLHINQVGRFENYMNVKELINKSFISLVSETIPTTFHPYVTEKVLFPIITSSIWIANAQPGYHKYLQDIYGFRLFEEIFDYSFDAIKDPVLRMVTMLNMISKYQHLTTDEWEDIKNMVKDKIQFNRNHYFSGNYFKCLQSVTY